MTQGLLRRFEIHPGGQHETRGALAKLAKLYDELLPYPDKAESFEKESLTAIVDRLIEPAQTIR